MRLSLLAAACLPWIAASAAASDFTANAIGTTGSQFLLTDVGARGIAMGGAYTAVVDDATSLYWNPAGLTRIPRASASFMYGKQVEDMSYQSLAYARRLDDASVLGGGLRYEDYGQIDHTDLSGNNMGTFHPRDYVAEFGWGESIYDLSDSEMDVTMGVAGRWIHSDYLQRADGYGGDIGIQSRFYGGPYPYDVAFVAQNMGRGQKFDRTRDTLPFRARLGAAAQPLEGMTVSLDAVMPSNNVAYGALGFEYAAEVDRNMKAAVRAGFDSLTLKSLGLGSTLSGGLGITVGDISFDYAFTPFGVLGSQVHRFSLSYNLPSKSSRRYQER